MGGTDGRQSRGGDSLFRWAFCVIIDWVRYKRRGLARGGADELGDGCYAVVCVCFLVI